MINSIPIGLQDIGPHTPREQTGIQHSELPASELHLHGSVSSVTQKTTPGNTLLRSTSGGPNGEITAVKNHKERTEFQRVHSELFPMYPMVPG